MRFATQGHRVLVFLACVVFTGGVLLAQNPADLVVVNANILVCDGAMTKASAMVIRNGQIKALGNSRGDVEEWMSATTSVLDAQQATITPGLADSHLHFVGLGETLQMLDLSEARTWHDIELQVEQAARSLPKGTWIEGRGWHQSKWDSLPENNLDGYPNHMTLSELVPDHPVLLTHASGHASFANAAAMKVAGVDGNTSDPSGGEVLRDKHGEPIGVFRENAQALIRRAKLRTMARLTSQQLLEQVAAQVELAAAECLRHGITYVHDAGSSFATARLLKSIAENDQLPLRISVMIREDSEILERQLATHRWTAVGHERLSVESVKVSIDGALGAHGAWLLEPYQDLPTTSGLNTVSIDELERVAKLCRLHGWQLCVHAIGDRANREVLDTFERIWADNKGTDHRWRIEHAQHLSPDDIPRFKQLGVIPAMQANHCTSDAIFVPQRLGERRSANGAYMWRSLLDTGVIIPNGTDAPVERVDPRASLFAAVTRKLPNGEVFYGEQCMTRREALLSYTLWPAIAVFKEQQLGSLEVGKLADFVLWDTNLLDCEPDAILTAQVLSTYVAGKIAYQYVSSP